MDEAVHTDTLNQRQEDFCQSYARYGNATRAGKEAGYSERTAHVQGHALLKLPKILRRIDEIKAERFRALHMDKDETLALLARQARFTLKGLIKVENGAPVVDLENATPDQLDALAEASLSETGVLKIKGPNVLGALTTLAKIQGLMKDQVELTVTESAADIMAAAHERARRARAEREGNE